jgi:hypothetical protein
VRRGDERIDRLVPPRLTRVVVAAVVHEQNPESRAGGENRAELRPPLARFGACHG